jgi:hypothetical protein
LRRVEARRCLGEATHLLQLAEELATHWAGRESAQHQRYTTR